MPTRTCEGDFYTRGKAVQAKAEDVVDLCKAQLIEHLFNLSLDMLCVAGTDGYFKQVNPAFGRILGFNEGELLSRPLWEFVVPEDRQKTLDELQKLSQGVASVGFENRYRTKTGEICWLSWMAMPEGEHGLIYATASDITARKKAEERFRLLLESAPDGMVIVDHGGKIVLVNAQTEKLFGYRREELIGQSVEILLPERFRPVHEQDRRCYAAKPHHRPMGSRSDLAAQRKDGSEFLAEISLSPIETEEGTLIASAIRDVSERRRIERSLRENEAQLLAAQRIQEYLLPRSAPALAGFDIAGASYPAEYAAGDHFDYLPMPGDALGIVISDVSGHGFAPALLMSLVHAYMHCLAETHERAEEILVRANGTLVKEIEENRFVTLFFGRLDPRSREFTYASAGHPTGYVLSEAGEVRHCLESTGPPLGVFADATFSGNGPVTLEAGDVVLLLTDGVLEAANPQQTEPFGVQRALDVVRANRQRTAAEIVAALYQAVRQFSQRDQQTDDITVVVVKRDEG